MFRRKTHHYAYGSLNSNTRSYTRSRRPIFFIIIGILLIVGIAILLNLTRIRLAFKGYSLTQQSEILSLKHGDTVIILKEEKLDHISDWIQTSTDVSYYNEFEKYYTLHPKSTIDEVVETVTVIMQRDYDALLKLGYEEESIWSLLETQTIDDLNYLVDHKLTYDMIKGYRDVKGFKASLMASYQKVYSKVKSYNYAVGIITYPMIDSSNKSDEQYQITNPKENLTLVKKGMTLSKNYEPDDLVSPSKTGIQAAKDCDDPKLRKEAYKALSKMAADARKEKLYILINSGYRSYTDQKKTYLSFKRKYGTVYAKAHVALPGSSEHQTGLGVDLTARRVEKGQAAVFGDTPEYKWVVKNAASYGFILRFPEKRSKMTGIATEPWHFRYVGKEAAKEIYENDWTLEEYCLYKGVIPEVK